MIQEMDECCADDDSGTARLQLISVSEGRVRNREISAQMFGCEEDCSKNGTLEDARTDNWEEHSEYGTYHHDAVLRRSEEE